MRKSPVIALVVGLLFCLLYTVVWAEGDQFIYSIQNGGITISKYVGTDSVVVVPSTIEGYPVRRIDQLAFANSNIVSLFVEEGIISIGQGAFADCRQLSSATLPKSIVTLEGSVFSNCEKLKDVVYPEKLSYVPQSCFSGCRSLKEFSFSDALRDIQGGSFAGSGLNDIVIPGGVRTVGSDAFSGCSGLKSVVLEHGIVELYWGAFAGCSSLEKVVLPSSLEYMGTSLFARCSSLTRLEIPPSVYRISAYAFSNCPSLCAIVIPPSITQFGYTESDGDTIFRDSPNVVIVAEPGSAAIQFALDHKLPYVHSEHLIPEKVILTESSLNLIEGKSRTLSAKIYPAHASGTLKWSSKAPSIATVDDKGTVTAESVGITQIYVMLENRPSTLTSCAVSVAGMPTPGNTSSFMPALAPGMRMDFQKVGYSYQNPDRYTWLSSNRRVASINDDGLLTAIALGETTISVYDGYRVRASWKVKVVEAKKLVSALRLPETVALKLGKAKTITLKFSPSKAISKTFYAESADAQIVTLSTNMKKKQLRIYPRKAGTTTVTVLASSGIVRVIQVVVK